MDKRVVFREWLPDLPPIVNPGLVKATNAFPEAGGYLPVPSLQASSNVLAARPLGSISGLDTSSNAFHIAGTSTKLYRVSSTGVSDVSRLVGGAYAETGSAHWNFEQFQNNVIAIGPSDDPQILDLGTANFVRLSVNAPRARYLCYVGPSLVFGNLVSDPVAGVAPNGVRSPNIDDPTDWPDPTNPASGSVAKQAQLTILQGNGGRINAMVGGAEVGAIFQENAVNRIEYVAGDVIHQIDPVKKSKGLIAPRAVAAFERQILYLAEDGWQLFDYSTSKPIGDQKINRTFVADFDQQYTDRVSSVLHPDLPLILVSYPGAGNMGGTPNKLLAYNYAIDQWSTIDMEMDLLTRYVPFGATLDSLVGNLDTDYPISFDDLIAAYGAAALGAYSTTHALSTFAGTSLTATFETGDQEHAPGRSYRVSKVRPLVDGVDPSVQVSARYDRRTPEASITFGSPSSLNREGCCPVRGAKGRYHRYRVTVPAGWTDHAVGLDVIGAEAGAR